MGWVFITFGVVVLGVAVLWMRRPLRPGPGFQWFATAQATAIGLALVSVGVAALTAGAVRTVAWMLAAIFLIGNIVALVGGILAARKARPTS
jgi:hypothetical protein